MVKVEVIHKTKQRIINIYMKGFDVYFINQYLGIRRSFNLFDESSKTCFNAWVKHYSRERYQINISSYDFYILKSLRYI